MTGDFEQTEFSAVEFAENPEPRCPVVLLLDTSGSMQGQRIDELNAGLQVFRDELNQDELAASRVEVAIVTFGPVAVETDFITAHQFTPPHLATSGSTPMGEGVEHAIALLRQRKDAYRANGINFYRPWIFLITDGAPTDSVANATELVAKGEERKEFMFYAVGVEGADFTALTKLSVRAPLKLKGLAFRELFSWLSSSLSSVSHSQTSDQVALVNPTAPDGWAVAGWTMTWCWASATRIGTSHVKGGSGCQDAHRCLQAGGTLVAVVSDGAGSAAEGGAGAAIVCRTMATGLAALVRTSAPIDDEALFDLVDRVRDRIALAAENRGLAPRDFAATLIAVVASADDTVAIHIGDGAAVVGGDEGWSAASWPESGEFAGTTFFVTDDAGARVRIARLGSAVDRVALTTDGLERLALDFARTEPHAPFFDGMMKPLAGLLSPGRSAAVSAGLGTFLDGDAVNSRTDDDKTLIVARRL